MERVFPSASSHRRNRAYSLKYHSEFLERDIPLSPYFLPLRCGTFFDDTQTFDGLSGVFNDSLPDGWGLLLLDRAWTETRRSRAQVSPLERLTLAGSNAMGALEYEPDASADEDGTSLDLDTLAGLDMPETRLFSSKDGAGYFGIRRFDRHNYLKIHTHTAAVPCTPRTASPASTTRTSFA